MDRMFNVGIVGATGAVGEELIKLLEERKFPLSDLRLFASAASKGRVIEACGRSCVVDVPSADGFRSLDIVFFSAGSGTSKQFTPIAVEAGARVIDNSSAFRMDANVPLVVPEINPDALTADTTIAAVPNCTAIMLVMGIAPLRKLGKIQRVIVSTYQAASGAGAKAMQELIDQTKQVLQGEKPIPVQFPHQIAFNLFSHNTPIDETGLNEEERKVVAETQKILSDPSIEVTPTCVRVPILRAHTESVHIIFDREIEEGAARLAYDGFPGVRVIDDRANNTFPMPIDASGTDDVLVGRIRKDLYNIRALNLLISGDQLRKGAALNSIQIAEEMIKFVRERSLV